MISPLVVIEVHVVLSFVSLISCYIRDKGVPNDGNDQKTYPYWLRLRRSEINHAGNQILYQYFIHPNHSVLSLKFRILQKYITLLIVPMSNPHRRNAKNTGLECWILLPRMDVMPRLIASGTSLAQEEIL